MNDPHEAVIAWAVRIADVMPPGVIRDIADSLAGGAAGQWTELRLRAEQVTPQPHLRSLIRDFLQTWQREAAEVTPQEVALALRTAAAAARAARAAQAIELVWTGPLVAGLDMRRTDQALLQVINSAQRSLLIVSFAVYKIPLIAAALVQAASRGVAIDICVEAPEPSGQKMAYDTIKALGADVASRARIYVWPADQRPADAAGHVGLLHAKCGVADRRLLFVSSANLTDHAMNLNIELGVLLHSQAHAAGVADQFERMVAQGMLRQVKDTP